MKTSLSFFAYSFSLAIVFAIGFQQSNLNAQAAGPEYDIFKKDVGAVSYTHLTLPTIYSV